MNKNILTLAILYPLLILGQALICNHIMLFNVATPFLFIYFIVRYPIGASRNLELTLAFLLGLAVDIFSDTPGVNALSCTLLAGIKPTIFYAYVTRDDKTKHITPSISSIGWQNYCKYLVTLATIFCLIEFTIEYFSFTAFRDVLFMTLGSTAITFLVVIGLDSLLPASKTTMA
ncbi:MAG: rod shape-determining protein MreD [Muribaculaceae bacterium]|nr:rod shape-determining protein MreD [Muribaculaceae bacterium]